MTEPLFRWRTIWRLPHPELVQNDTPIDCRIEIDHRRWEHIVERHLQEEAEQTVWREWLGAAIVESLCDRRTKDPPKRISALARASRFVENGLRKSFRRPLVLMQTEMGRQTVEKWIGVLPEGAVCCIAWFRRSSGIVQTIFFPYESVGERRADRRWKRTVKTLVMRYASRQTQDVYKLPKCEDVIPVCSKVRSVFLTNIRYVTAREWGFDGDNPGAVWNEERLKPWADNADATKGKKE